MESKREMKGVKEFLKILLKKEKRESRWKPDSKHTSDNKCVLMCRITASLLRLGLTLSQGGDGGLQGTVCGKTGLRHTFCGCLWRQDLWLDHDPEIPTSGSLWTELLFGPLIHCFSFTEPPYTPYFISVDSGHRMLLCASADFSGLWTFSFITQSYCASLICPAVGYLSLSRFQSPLAHNTYQWNATW